MGLYRGLEGSGTLDNVKVESSNAILRISCR